MHKMAFNCPREPDTPRRDITACVNSSQFGLDPYLMDRDDEKIGFVRSDGKNQPLCNCLIQVSTVSHHYTVAAQPGRRVPPLTDAYYLHVPLRA